MRIFTITTMLSAIFIGQAAAAIVADDALTTFVPDTSAKADEVNQNFTSLKDAINQTHEELDTHNHDNNYYNKSEVDSKVNTSSDTLDEKINAHDHDSTYHKKMHIEENYINKSTITTGSNYIPNSTLEAGTMGWEAITDLSSGDLVIVDTDNGPASEQAFQNPQHAVTWGSSTSWITIDRNKTYYVSGTFNRESTGSTGTIYLAVRLRASDGTEIQQDGYWWFYPAKGLEPAADQWTHYRAEFGADTTRPFPNNARYATVGFILNYVPDAVGDRIYLVQGLAIHDATASNKCVDNMVSFGNGCISPVEPIASTYFAAQNTCKSKYKGSICMQHEILRACASGAISSIGNKQWMGDHGLVAGGDIDDEYIITNSAECTVNIDGLPKHAFIFHFGLPVRLLVENSSLAHYDAGNGVSISAPIYCHLRFP